MRGLALFFSFSLITGLLRAQVADDFYDPGKVQEIRITFGEKDWKNVLDSLFVTFGDSVRLKGDVSVNGVHFNDCGIRYKGYSSWNHDAVKNPFNIDLDYSNPGIHYKGHSKIKLSNVIHDPSFVREVLAYETARKYLPAPRANFARLYVNDTLIGLYTNVEAVDKKFIAQHFGDEADSFFKGEPEKLVYPFGENANLAYSHGTDSSGYLPYYKNESDNGWNQLLRLIRILDNAPDSLGHVLNIDRTLWMHAFNYTLLNLDSYIGYSQNYYLCRDHNGLFNPIPWDLNMSFGSFRESDASTNFLGISIPKLKILDPLQHLKFSISPRPLMKNLFLNDTLKRMYLAHIRTLVNENIDTDILYHRAQELQEQIAPYVLEDTNRFYSYEDFVNNLESTVGGTSVMIQYPGIHDLLEARAGFLSALPGISGAPEIGTISCTPEVPETGEDVEFRVEVAGALRVFLGYRFREKDIFTRAVMNDDGISGDDAAGDGVYGTRITVSGDVVQYYIYAENDTAGAFSPPAAEIRYHTLQAGIRQGELVINEVSYGNSEAIISGRNATNWIELLNNSSENVSVKGLTLSAGPDEARWNLPDTVVAGKGFLLLAAEDVAGPLNSCSPGDYSPGELFLWAASGKQIDVLAPNAEFINKTTGRYPNGQGPAVLMPPTPGSNNLAGYLSSSGFRVYPVPAHDKIIVEFINKGAPAVLELIELNGQKVLTKEIPIREKKGDVTVISLDVSSRKGLYLLKLNNAGTSGVEKIMIY